MSAATSEPLRKLRACLAEVGYPPEAVNEDENGLLWWQTSLVPPEVMWRARVTVELITTCFSCWSHSFEGYRSMADLPEINHKRLACLSGALFTADCGLVR